MDAAAKREDMKLEKAYKTDERDFPWCSRSVQSEQNCETGKDGEYVCDIFRKLTRYCENADPVDIFTSRRKVKQPEGLGPGGSLNFHRKSSSSKSLAGGEMDLNDLAGGLEQIVNEMEKRHEMQMKEFDKHVQQQRRDREKTQGKLSPPPPNRKGKGKGGRTDGPEEKV